MKFELKPYNRDLKDQDLIDDLINVAKKLNIDYIGVRQYTEHGKFHSATITRRFGSWNVALEKAGFSTKYFTDISDNELLEDLKQVAKTISPKKVTQKIYNDIGKFSARTINERFRWNKALILLGLEISNRTDITENELFKNLENVWIEIGKQPGKRDMNSSISKFSERPYISRYGTWRNALEAFVQYINSESNDKEKTEKLENNNEYVQIDNNNIIKHKTKRDISARLKVQVLIRDGNKCKLCGATLVGENIHFDHIKPWAKGGETVFENIQVLCSSCNLAKGDYYPEYENED